MQNEITNLIAIIKNINRSADSPYLIYRNQSELDFLDSFIKKNEAAPNVITLEKSKNFDNISDIIKSCEKCQDICERKLPFGNAVNKIMILINAPIMLSGVEKKIYKNDSIKLLKKMIQAVKLVPEECYITNLIKCETKNSLNQPSQMFNRCQDILKREIEEIKPEVILVMGELSPLNKFCKIHKDISWFNVDHPITLLKNPDIKRNAWNTLQNLIQHLENL